MFVNKRVLTVVGACFLALACSAGMDAQSEGENVSSDEQSLNSACGTFPAQFTYLHNVSPTLVTSAYSGGCDGNSIMFDVNSYSSLYMPPYITPNSPPTNATDCQNTTLRYYVWEKTSTSVLFLGNKSATGVWNPGGGFVPAECEFAANNSIGLSSPVALQAGHDYRFGVTARYINTPVTLRVNQTAFPR